jgi:hypothetical protein
MSAAIDAVDRVLTHDGTAEDLVMVMPVAVAPEVEEPVVGNVTAAAAVDARALTVEEGRPQEVASGCIEA